MNLSQWSIILHLSGLAGLVLPGFGNWLAPLVIWLLKKEDSPALDALGKEVVNFQLSYTLYCLLIGVVGGILTFILIGFLFFLLLPILAVAWIAFMILAAIKASNGESYRYPLIIRFLS